MPISNQAIFFSVVLLLNENMIISEIGGKRLDQASLPRHVALRVVGGRQSRVTNLYFSLNKLGLLLDYPSRLILRYTQITQLKIIFIFGLTHCPFYLFWREQLSRWPQLLVPNSPPHCISVSAGDCFHCRTPWRTSSKAWRVISTYVS